MAQDGAPGLRAFVALELDARSVRRVVRVADRLRMGSGAPSATWTPAAKIHLTVDFLGVLSPESALALGAALEPLGSGRPPSLGTFQLDAFPTPAAARVVIARLEDPSGEVAELAAQVARTAERLGIPPEGRPYVPHVTLARLKVPFDVRRWLRPDLAGADACSAVRLTLFESRPGDHGNVYVPLASYPYAE